MEPVTTVCSGPPTTDCEFLEPWELPSAEEAPRSAAAGRSLKARPEGAEMWHGLAVPRRPRLGRSQAFDSSRTPDPRRLRSTLRMMETKFLTSPSPGAGPGSPLSRGAGQGPPPSAARVPKLSQNGPGYLFVFAFIPSEMQ
ncbi:putative uncharacterized protein encoded by LINC00336 [Cebus imitator]|uniref:putative uncharacterized protein encoded by LINC00336 n=1 Tax=Cebus imitator TaxID=2715852 RepID=UPI00189A97A7|nr:putative uncharacterized protein encoded by LINC00336 [Cebus imitator]